MSVLGLCNGRRLRARLSFSGVFRLLSLAVLAGGLACAYGMSSAKAATFNPLPVPPLPGQEIIVDNYGAVGVQAWYSDDYHCAGGACSDGGVQSAVEQLLGPTLDYDRIESLTGGTNTIFTYAGDPYRIFAVKGGNHIMVLLLFSEAITGWTITGLDNAVSNISTLNPVPLPPAALLFLTGLAGIGLVARRRRARLGTATP